MNRIFHRRITIQDMAAIALLAIAALVCFWQRTGSMAVLGTCLGMTALVAIERTIHTTYTITDKGVLHINKGRLSHPVAVDISDIGDITEVRAHLLRPACVALQLSGNRWLMVRPDNSKAFLKEIDKQRWKNASNWL